MSDKFKYPTYLPSTVCNVETIISKKLVLPLLLRLLLFVLSAAVTEAVLESKCVVKLLKAMKTFPKTRSLQWKVGEAGGVGMHRCAHHRTHSCEQPLRSVPPCSMVSHPSTYIYM